LSEQYIVWALVVGVAIGAALYWFAVGRLARRTDDLAPGERDAEARWISRTIESRGGVAPVDLVDEVLGLHSSYLTGPALDPDPVATNPLDGARRPPATRLRDEPPGN
jgi:HAMP domain-containing protein